LPPLHSASTAVAPAAFGPHLSQLQ